MRRRPDNDFLYRQPIVTLEIKRHSRSSEKERSFIAVIAQNEVAESATSVMLPLHFC
jgi:hypothetical protein